MLDMNIKKWMKFMFEHKDQFSKIDESLKYKIKVYPNVEEQEKDSDLFMALSLILNNCNSKKEQKGVTEYNKKFPFKCDEANFLNILNYQKKYTGTVDTMVQKSISYMPGHYYKTVPKMISTAFKRVEQSYRTQRAVNIWQNYLEKNSLQIDAKELLEDILKEQKAYIEIYVQFPMYNSSAWANCLDGIMNLDAHALYIQNQETMIGIIVHELYHDFDERIKNKIMRNKGVNDSIDLPGETARTTGIAQIQKTKEDPSFYVTKGGDLSRFSTRRYPTHESSIFLRGIEDILTPQARASLTKASISDPRYPNQRFREYELDPTEMYVRLKKLQNRLGDKQGYVTFEKLKQFLNDKNPNKYGADYDIESLINNFDTSSDEKIRKIIDFLNKRVAVAPTQQRTQVAENKKNMKEEWSDKYKKSINCKNPKGFSQRAHCQGRKKNEGNDPKEGTGKKPKGSGRRLYTDENPKDTISVKFSTAEDLRDTLSKESFKSKSHARQSQIINLIHQRVRAAHENAKDPETKARLGIALDYAEKRKEASKKKTASLQKEEVLTEKCWPGYTQKGMKTMFGKKYPNCVKKTNEEIELEERKLGKPSSETSLRDWFKRKGAPGKRGGWVDCNTCRNGKCSPCGRQGGEKRSKYPRCRPTPAQCKGYKRRGDNLQREEEQ